MGRLAQVMRSSGSQTSLVESSCAHGAD